jgi:hypothetical protein
MRIRTQLTARYRRLMILCLLPILVLIASGLKADSKIRELEGRTADIALLKGQLGDRQRQAETVLEELEAFQSEVLDETRIILKSYRIATLEETLAHQRLGFNLRLIQETTAYMLAFNDKIRFYKTGQDKLVYLHQLVQDDLKMSATLNHYEIDALTTQISLLVNRYLQDAHAIQIDPQLVEPISLQQVWELVQTTPS